MPIPLPNLDDRTYTELVAEAQAMIPTVYPEWTNHNPSDPGVVLTELLAWLTEMTLFQVNEITDGHTEAFLELLNGPEWSLDAVGDLDTAVYQTIGRLRERHRAVSSADFEHLVSHAWPQMAEAQALGANGEIARVCSLPNCDLEANASTIAAPSHVSVVVLPQNRPKTPEATANLLNALWTFLDSRRLLTVIHHVLLPDYVPVTIQARIYIREDVLLADAVDLLDGPETGLTTFFDSYSGGPEQTGWPFGRGVYTSEIYAILSQLAVVDYVEDVLVSTGKNAPNPVAPNPVEVEIDKHQLIEIDLSGIVVVDVYGNELKIS